MSRSDTPDRATRNAATADGTVDDSTRPGPRGRPAPDVLTLVGASLKAVRGRPVRFAECFYTRLFERTPQLRELFPENLDAQHERLAGALQAAMKTAVSADAEAIAGFELVLARMGARHATHYQVRAEYYPLIGDALVQAARDVAGVHWSTRTSSAWVAVYEWLAGHMIRGAAAAGDLSPIPSSLDRAVTAAATPAAPAAAPGIVAGRARPAPGQGSHPGPGGHDVTRPLPVLPPDTPGRVPHPGPSRPEDSTSPGTVLEESPAALDAWTPAQLAHSPLSLLVAAGGQR